MNQLTFPLFCLFSPLLMFFKICLTFNQNSVVFRFCKYSLHYRSPASHWGVMFAALLSSHEFCLESKSSHLHPPKKRETQSGSASTQEYSGGSAAALGSGILLFLAQALLCLPFGRDTGCVCAHLGEQELGSSRGTSDSTAECTWVLSAENQHGHHYWQVCHSVEHTKSFSLLSLAPV